MTNIIVKVPAGIGGPRRQEAIELARLVDVTRGIPFEPVGGTPAAALHRNKTRQDRLPVEKRERFIEWERQRNKAMAQAAARKRGENTEVAA